jgi:hypothetical protein
MHREEKRFYSLKPAVANTETGQVFPQIQKMTRGYDYDSATSVYELAKFVHELPKFKPNLDAFLLNNKAHLTDVLSTSLINSSGILISEKLKYIFSKSKTAVCDYYPACVSYKKNIYDYFWMHLKSISYDSIVFLKSKFIVVQNYAYPIDTINISSLEDYVEKKNTLKETNSGKNITIWSEIIAFNSQFDKHIDLFRVGTFDTNIYISERLKSVIEENRITGLDISPTTNLIFL